MLYLFGQLALSDSLFYHEDFFDDDCRKGSDGPGTQGSGTTIRAELISRREIPALAEPPISRVPAERRA